MTNKTIELATFGAGCFWGVEARFREQAGVVDTAVGYAGGHTDNPEYREVCSGATGHAEVVQVGFDPEVIKFEDLIDLFWSSHNPTTLNRQGPDRGTQYRSVIFYHSEEQRDVAVESRKLQDESGRFSSPIVTAIEPAQTFFRAEEYHQQYLEKKGLASCSL